MESHNFETENILYMSKSIDFRTCSFPLIFAPPPRSRRSFKGVNSACAKFRFQFSYLHQLRFLDKIRHFPRESAYFLGFDLSRCVQSSEHEDSFARKNINMEKDSSYKLKLESKLKLKTLHLTQKMHLKFVYKLSKFPQNIIF